MEKIEKRITESLVKRGEDEKGNPIHSWVPDETKEIIMEKLVKRDERKVIVKLSFEDFAKLENASKDKGPSAPPVVALAEVMLNNSKEHVYPTLSDEKDAIFCGLFARTDECLDLSVDMYYTRLVVIHPEGCRILEVPYYILF